MFIGRIIKHVFVLSSLAIAIIAIVMSLSGMLDAPGTHFDLRGMAARAEAPASQSAAPATLARHIFPNDGEPAGKP